MPSLSVADGFDALDVFEARPSPWVYLDALIIFHQNTIHFVY